MSANDVIADLFGRLDDVKGRHGPGAGSGARRRAPVGKAGGRAMFERMIRGAPEAVVKLAASSRNARQIRAHLMYTTRNGQLPIEDERGELHIGREGVSDVVQSWQDSGFGMPVSGDRRREALHMLFAMPAGTDRPSVTRAVRAFAAEQYAGHEYAFVAHDDKPHPHVHLIVKMTGDDGTRMDPRKADLYRWRVAFADAMTEQGVETAATPRAARGKVHRNESFVAKQIDEAYARGERATRSVVTVANERAAHREVDTGERVPVIAREQIEKTRREVIGKYARIATELANGGEQDRQLALDVVRFVRSMPPTTTRHEERVQAIRNAQAREHGAERGRER